jgi:hypothetical protein
MKKNKFGIKQERILVINSRKKMLLLLDERRKFKKQFEIKSIIQVSGALCHERHAAGGVDFVLAPRRVC